MRLATFAVDAPTGAIDRIGLVRDETLLDLTAAFATLLAEEDRTRPIETA